MAPASRRLLEHRCTVRHPVGRTVCLRSASRGELAATLVNIGAGGACIHLDGDTTLGCRLVELLMPDREGTRSWPALVVHRNGPVLGLMFDRPRYREVSRLLADPARIGARRPAARGREAPATDIPAAARPS